jgi:outer membrane receptor for ferrienterochelin and colicins
MRIVFLLLIINPLILKSQILSGYVFSDENKPISYATITLKETKKSVLSDQDGYYIFSELPKGKAVITINALGFKTIKQEVNIDKDVSIDFVLEKKIFKIDEIVITGSRTFKRQTKSPVIVSVITNETLNNVEACNLSEGLKYQPGVRVETDCQTCNYTQLRMNGLGGGYSQILINGRPTFSPLTGLYGMEQIPTNMIDRIEIVRGGGSSLYGSSAIGGTVNVITKVPTENTTSLYSNYLKINNKHNDIILSGNTTVVSKNKKFGTAIFLNQRDRDWYDHNDDNFSEIPTLKNKSFGTTLYYIPSDDSKLEINIGSIYEYRYGGEMIVSEPHFAMQSEERVHNLLIANADYMKTINDNTSFITYLATQKTDRLHYTGIRPEIGTEEDITHLTEPPYGTSNNTTNQLGLQFNLKDYLFNNSLVTIGSEFLEEYIIDEIDSYNYLIDQKTRNIGTFIQLDWNLNENINLLSGARLDKHNMLKDILISPRISMMYTTDNNIQFRTTWSTGFRSPQAFDSDLHIAFAGGGVSRITLSNDLEQENSNSFSTSINYDNIGDHYIAGFTLESFYTRLDNVFYLHPIGNDEFGDLFEKRNGSGATVKGITLELRANYDQKIQLEGGYTIQSSLFDEAIYGSIELEPRQDFMKTPNMYGYAILSFTPNNNFYSAVNMVYTGKMDMIHFAGDSNQLIDEYIVTDNFLNIGIKSTYIFNIDEENSLELSLGIKNILNQYQNDFDSFKNRDSNFTYGPAMPRTYFTGIKYNLN